LGAVRPLLAIGGGAAALGFALLVYGIRAQVAWSDCQVHCIGRNPWPVTGMGIALLIGGVFVALWALVSEHAGRMLHPERHEREERNRLRRVGMAGTARVLKATEAGTSAVGDPVVEVELAVEVEGRPPYEVRQRTAVPRRRLHRLHAGRAVPVLVDPHDPERLIVEWAEQAG
jgi:hypothetical protein